MNSRDKGKRFELLISHKLQDYGFPARRTAQYCGNSGDASDVVGLPGIHIECKAQEQMRLYEWMEQAVRDASAAGPVFPLPIVIHKRNKMDILVTMRLDDWMTWYKSSIVSKGE